MNKKPWPLDRRRQLKALIELISEVRSINSGNRVLERLQRCIHLADLLDEWDAGKPRRSFIAWLRAMAVGEEEGK